MEKTTTKQAGFEFKLPEIDRDETRDKVEDALNACRLFMQIGYHTAIEPGMTQKITDMPPSVANAFHSSTESVAIKNVDTEQYRRDLVKHVLLAVGRLSKQEKEIITKRYLDEDDVFDYEIYNELNLGERKYYRVKGRAFYKLALILKIEVYTEDEAKEV